VAWVDGSGLLELLRPFQKLLLSQVSQRQVVVCVERIGFQLERPAEMLDCGEIVAPLELYNSKREVCFGQFWIYTHRQLESGFSLRKIVSFEGALTLDQMHPCSRRDLWPSRLGSNLKSGLLGKKIRSEAPTQLNQDKEDYRWEL
jgi:hypothetical protein